MVNQHFNKKKVNGRYDSSPFYARYCPRSLNNNTFIIFYEIIKIKQLNQN